MYYKKLGFSPSITNNDILESIRKFYFHISSLQSWLLSFKEDIDFIDYIFNIRKSDGFSVEFIRKLIYQTVELKKLTGPEAIELIEERKLLGQFKGVLRTNLSDWNIKK